MANSALVPNTLPRSCNSGGSFCSRGRQIFRAPRQRLKNFSTNDLLEASTFLTTRVDVTFGIDIVLWLNLRVRCRRAARKNSCQNENAMHRRTSLFLRLVTIAAVDLHPRLERRNDYVLKINRRSPNLIDRDGAMLRQCINALLAIDSVDPNHGRLP